MNESITAIGRISAQVESLLFGARKWAAYAAYTGGNRSTLSMFYVWAADDRQAAEKCLTVNPHEKYALVEMSA